MERGVRDARRATYENARPEVQELVPADAGRILDIGCSSGALGAALKARQDAEVIGIEIDPGYAADARNRLDDVIEGDAERVLADPPRGLGSFDCVIAADVLEHMNDPWATLESSAQLLPIGGSAVVSLPNVRYWETLWQVGVRGTWPRRDDGVFDRTHLRWFTGLDAARMMDEAGVPLAEVSRRYRLKPSDWSTERYARWIGRTPLRPFFVYQYVLRGTRHR